MVTRRDLQRTLTHLTFRRIFVTKGERRVLTVEEDGANSTATIGLTRKTSFHEVRTERYSCQSASRCLVEATSLAIHQEALYLLTHVVRHETVVGFCSDSIQLIVTDSDVDSWHRDEADALLVELLRCSSCRIPCHKLTTEVELVVGLAWEADDIRLGSCQQRILL